MNEQPVTPFDVFETDRLLRTTRSVRKRLDLETPVDLEEIRLALEVAVQAPSGNSAQDWRFAIVTDAQARSTVGSLYRESYHARTIGRPPLTGESPEFARLRRVRDSAGYLAEVMGSVPVLVVACLASPPPTDGHGPGTARFYASIYPAVWSLQLALRSRGYGSCITTAGLTKAAEINAALGLPTEWTQCAILPVAHTLGTEFRAARRQPLDQVTQWI